MEDVRMHCDVLRVLHTMTCWGSPTSPDYKATQRRGSTASRPTRRRDPLGRGTGGRGSVCGAGGRWAKKGGSSRCHPMAGIGVVQGTRKGSQKLKGTRMTFIEMRRRLKASTQTKWAGATAVFPEEHPGATTASPNQPLTIRAPAITCRDRSSLRFGRPCSHT